MVPSARLVRVLGGAELAPPAPPLWLAVRNGAGFTFCGTLLPSLYGAAAGRVEPPLAAGSDGREIGAAPPEGGAAEADAGVVMLPAVPAPNLSFDVHPCATSKIRAIEKIARYFTTFLLQSSCFHST